MKTSIGFFLTVVLLFALPAQCQVDEPLRLIQSIALPGLHDGSFGHFHVDLTGQRLFVAAEANSPIELIDIGTNKLIHTIPVPSSYHGITAILVPELNRYYVAVNHYGTTDAKVQVYEVVQ